MSTLVEHARRELALIGKNGEDPALTENIVAMLAVFASFGHSGASAEIAADYVAKLLHKQNLTPLTSSPGEWDDVSHMSSVPLWQNLRNSKFFSEDGGRTCYHVDHSASRSTPEEAIV